MKEKFRVLRLFLVVLLALSPTVSLADLQDDFEAAIYRGDVPKVEEMLNTWWVWRPSFRRRQGRASPLNIAIEKKDVRMVKLLLQKGANPNEISEGYSLLSDIVRQQEEELVKALLDHGAKIDGSALERAAELDDPKMMKLLIERGANVDHAFGLSPLYTASTRGNVETVRLLLEHRVKVDFNPFTALDGWSRAFRWDTHLPPLHAEIIELFIKNGLDVNMTFKDKSNKWDGNIYSPLVYAAAKGRFEWVQAIMNSPKFDREKAIQVALALGGPLGSNIAHQIRTNFKAELFKLKPKSEIVQKIADTNKSCGICLNEFNATERVTILPDNCLYAYHPDCIGPWLKIRQSCPMCNHELNARDGALVTLPFPDMTHNTGETKIGESSPKVSNQPNKTNKKRKLGSFQDDSSSPHEAEGAARPAQ